MDVSAVFTPVAIQLVDQTFGTSVIYRRDNLDGYYDPTTGLVTRTTMDIPIKAAILNRSRVEEGGTAETYLLTVWVHHGPTGVPFIPTTGDVVVYDGIEWALQTIEPTYSADTLIASKLVCRGPG